MRREARSSLNSEQLDLLQRDFRLTADPSQDRSLSIPSVDLLDEAGCSAYLDRLDEIYPAAPDYVKASMFAKRYSFMMIASGLYAMSLFNQALDYSIGNCHIESHRRDQIWLPSVRLTDWRTVKPGGGDRAEWRDEVIGTIFAGHIAKVWRALSKTAPISRVTLWENTAVYVYWLYEKRIGAEAAEQQPRVREDYQYLLHQAPASLFGEKENPLARFHSAPCRVSASGQRVRIRETCCYYDQVAPDRACCSTCPRKP